MLRILKKLKSGYVNSQKIVAFDTETYQTHEDKFIRQDFLCGSAVGDGISFFTKDKEELADFLLSRKIREYKIYATNLEFDFFHTFLGHKKLKKFKFIDKNGIIFCQYKTNPDSEESWTFIDTYNYTGKISVDRMGKILGLKKLDYPKAFKRIPTNDEEWEEMKAYNINDSFITYKFADFYVNTFCNLIGAKAKITLASTGLDFWRRNHQPCDIFQERREWVEKHFEGSMHGGRTEVFKRGFFGKPHWYYDFNSHYPARCREGTDGKGSYPMPSSSHYSKNITLNMIYDYEGITKVRVLSPPCYIPILGISNKDGKYIFPCGEFEGWFTNIELRYALKNGCEIKEIFEGIYYTENFMPFRKAVDYLYALRMKYREENNQPMQMMVKILMNSALFGKFAQKIDSKTELHNIENLVAEKDGTLFVKKGEARIPISDFVRRGNFVFERIKTPSRIPIYIMPILASYTTAMARIKLHESAMVNQKAVVYCDTDSIICNRPMFETSQKLGDLKLECKIKEMIVVKPKLYYYNDGEKNILKSKGVGAIIRTKEDFLKLLDTKKVFSPKEEKGRFTKLKEGFVRKLPFSAIIDFEKYIDLEDDKRFWNGRIFSATESQDSLPIIYSQE